MLKTNRKLSQAVMQSRKRKLKQQRYAVHICHAHVFSIRPAVDFQRQRKRSKVYPQLNFLLLRKIAPELGFVQFVCARVCTQVHVCVCVYVCDRLYNRPTYIYRDLFILFQPHLHLLA